MDGVLYLSEIPEGFVALPEIQLSNVVNVFQLFKRAMLSTVQTFVEYILHYLLKEKELDHCPDRVSVA